MRDDGLKARITGEAAPPPNQTNPLRFAPAAGRCDWATPGRKRSTMARKSSYSFQRRQRDLAKAEKRQAKRDARAAKKPDRSDAGDDDERPNVVRLPGEQ